MFPSRPFSRGRGPSRRFRGAFHPGKCSFVTTAFRPTSSSWQALPFFPTVAAPVCRPLGPSSSAGSCHRFCIYTSADARSQTSFYESGLQRGCPARAFFPVSQRGHPTSSGWPGIFEHHFSGAQGHRRFSFSPQPPRSQRLCHLPALQDGGHPSPQGHSVRTRLVHTFGPARCLPHGPYPPGLQTVSAFPLGLGDLAVYMPAVWPQLRSLGVLQAFETRYCLFPGSRCPLDSLPGRYSPLSRGPCKSTSSDRVGGLLAHSAGFPDQPQEIEPGPLPEDCISGLRDRLHSGNPTSSSSEDGSHQEGIERSPFPLFCLPSTTGSSGRPPVVFHSSYFSWPLTLQVHAATQGSPSSPLSILRPAGAVDPRGTHGNSLVAASHGLLERLCHFRGQSRFCYGIGCQPLGLGSRFPIQGHGGSLVPFGAFLPHQLLGALGGVLCGPQFAKPLSNCCILLRMDNVSAVRYINRLGGVRSAALSNLAKDLHHFCFRKGISLQAEYIPGVSNFTADWFSRYWRDVSDWRLEPTVFASLLARRGPLVLDLFASRWNHQLPRFFSWLPDPLALAADAFSQAWPPSGGYAFPPFSMIARTLCLVRRLQLSLLLITPLWPAQPWFPLLLLLSYKDPLLLPPLPSLLLDPVGSPHPLVSQGQLRLVAWSLSGNPEDPDLYRLRLPLCSAMPGPLELTGPIGLPGADGSAGVCRGRLIPLLPL